MRVGVCPENEKVFPRSCPCKISYGFPSDTSMRMEAAIEALTIDGLVQYVKEQSNEANSAQTKELMDVIQSKVDRLIRMRALDIASSPNCAVEDVRSVVAFAVAAFEKGYCSKTLPISCMSDIFDIQGVSQCEKLFTVMEENEVAFKVDPNAVLRVCNDLVKRLSRCSETSFVGRILFFLSRFLSLAEKSGLNLVGQFNTQNVTKFEQNAEAVPSSSLLTEQDAEMESGEIKENKDSSIPVDHNLYVKFWEMQEFFCSPNSCYDKEKWKVFNKNTSEVLSVFASYKLERSSGDDGKKSMRAVEKETQALEVDDNYFAKYLTSPKLLQLQFNDSQFRRSFLLQCLILFQYLTAEVKFKQKSYVLDEDMLRFVIESQDRCYKLLRETHPKGGHFADSIKKILIRENERSAWKNGGCIDFAGFSDPTPMNKYMKRPRVSFDPKQIDLGNQDLNRLWTVHENILESCKSEKRKFTPSLLSFLQDPIDELDPAQQVEEQYKSIYEESFQWKASRVLLSQSAHFIGSAPLTGEVPKMLETAILKTARDVPELRQQLEEREAKEAEARKREEERIRERLISKHEGSPAPDLSLSDVHLTKVAEILAARSTDLAKAMGLTDEHIENLNKKHGSEDSPTQAAVGDLLHQYAEEHGNSCKRLLNFLLENELLTSEITKILKSSSACAESSV